MDAASLISLSSFVLGDIGHGTLPQHVPWHVLDAMGWDPIIYLSERAMASPLLDAALYVVEHDDPRLKAETEAWLRPLLPRLLPVIVRALSLGAAPYVFNWVSEDLTISVARDGAAPKKEELPQHQHYGSVHDLHPGTVQLRVEDDRLIEVIHAQNTYKDDRAFVSVWDAQFGQWDGKASRRRAYKPWFDSLHAELWQGRYLERSVDPPRIGYAPKGDVTINGETMRATTLLASAVMALKNGGAGILPGIRDKDGNYLYEVAPMQLPDVHSVWHDALDAYDAKMMLAALVPPTTGGLSEGSFSGARIPNDMFVELLEGAASWVAEQLTCIVAMPHIVNRTGKTKPPVVKSRELPRDKIKRLEAIYQSAATVERRTANGKTVTLAELIDVSILDELGIKRRSVEDAARDSGGGGGGGEAPSGAPGRPREPMGDREERRRNAKTPEGEDDVGAVDGAPKVSTPTKPGTPKPGTAPMKEERKFLIGHITTGVVTVNEARGDVGLSPREGGDVTSPELLKSLGDDEPDEDAPPAPAKSPSESTE